MAWYWIVAIVVGVIFTWAFSAAVMHKYCDLDDIEAPLLSILPFVWIFALFYIVYHFLKKIV